MFTDCFLNDKINYGKEIAGSLIGCFSYLFCALILMGFGIYALKSKNPINFWAGDKVPPEKITDSPAYLF